MAFPLPQVAFVALTLLAWSAPARAQTSAPPGSSSPSATEGGDANVSSECRAPSSAIFAGGALPNLDSALQEGRPIRVLALGPFPPESFGSGPGSAKYTAKLQTALQRVLAGVPVVVEGRRLSGEITTGAPEYVTNTVMDVRPDLVVWSAGMHEALARAEIDPFSSAVGEILEWLRSHDIDVVLVEPPYAAAVADDEHYSALVKSLRAVAQQDRVPIVLRYEAMRYLAGQRTDAPEQHFHLHDLSRRCAPEYVAKAVAGSLASPPAGR